MLYALINPSSIILVALDQQFIQPTHRILLHARQHMRVDIHRHADLRMAEHLLDDLGVDAEAKK